MSKKIETLKVLLNLKQNTRRNYVTKYYEALEDINAMDYNYPDWFDDKGVDEQFKKLD